MNIHEAAVKILHTPNKRGLPALNGFGLCRLFQEIGVEASAYSYMGAFTGGGKLSHYGHWTEQRLNIVTLLAITTPEDFI